MRKNILHLCVNFGDSKFYGNLFKLLEDHYQTVVVSPFRSESQVQNANKWCDNTYILHKKIIFNIFDRFLQKRKSRKYLDYVKSCTNDTEKVDLIHAHSLYSDGSVAYKLWTKKKIKYVVTVRNTDINIFWKWFFWRRQLGRNIITNAQSVYVPSESYRKIITTLFFDAREKIVVIPNGVEEQFFEHSLNLRKKPQRNLLFVGEFTRNKNILKLINLLSKNRNWHLDVIGFGKLQRQVEKRSHRLENVRFHGYVSDTYQKIQMIDDADIIVVPSKTELFGIAFAESIVRGRPIVGTIGQGLDGFFGDRPVGVFLPKLDMLQLYDALDTIHSNYSFYQQNSIYARNLFQWPNIVAMYKVEYENVCQL